MKCKKHKKASGGEICLAKVTSFFFTASLNKSNDAAFVGGSEFASHTMKHHSTYIVDTRQQTALVFYSKEYFLLLI